MFSLVKKSAVVFCVFTATFVGTDVSAHAAPASVFNAAGPTAQQKEAFINTAAPLAQQARKKYGIPASVMIAEAAIESRWGDSTLSKEDHNYFGLECIDNSPHPGPATRCISMANKNGADRQTYRVYETEGDSFADYARLVATNQKYSEAMKYRNDPDQFIERLAPVYDPANCKPANCRYAKDIITTMKAHDLYKYDT